MTSAMPAMTMTSSNLTIHTSEVDICGMALPPTVYQTFYAVVVVILMSMDLFILTAVIVRWGVLRRNIVHVYLISLLLSVICFCVVSMCEMFQSIHMLAARRVEGGLAQRYNPSDPMHRSVFRDDAYLKGVVPALLLIMEFNIAALVYAISDGTFIVGRYGEASGLLNKFATHEDENRIVKARSVKSKRVKATVVLATAWLIPLALSVPVAFGWNCVKYCMCLPMYRIVPTCRGPQGSWAACSRTWPPMARSYVITTSVLYLICIAIMAITLLSTVQKFYKTHRPRKKNEGVTPTEHVEREQSGAPSGGLVKAGANDMKRPNDATTEPNDRRFSRTRPSIYTRKGRPPLGDTIKLIIYLTIFMFLFITPLELLVVVDFLRVEDPTVDEFAVSLAITFLYVASVPVILLIYMAGVRKACIHILMKFPCFRKTIVTVKRKNTRTATVPDIASEEKVEET